MFFTGEINRSTVKKEEAQHLVRYKLYLHSYYKKDPIARDDKLGIAPSSEFINLALVRHDGSTYRRDSDSTKGVSGGSLDLDSVVTDSKFVLVEGDAGMGKSTLCWELCRKWDDLKSLQHYKIVVLQKLREIRLQKATTLNEIFHHDNPALNKGVVDEIYRCEGEGVLLILDGFDEMPDKLIRDEGCFIMKVIKGSCLPKATILVTSRPSAIQYNFPQKFRHIKTLGFTDESIEQFAEKVFAGNSEVLENFKTFILSNPIIKSMVHIPLSCAILAQVYKDIMKSTMPMPKTMTQLYTTLVLVLIRRRMIERGEWDRSHRVPAGLNGLPDKVTAPLKIISELAYRGLFKNEVQLFFSDDEVGEDFEHLGLLNEAKEMYVSEGARSTYSFSHKSMQEFLAAGCVAHYPDMIGEPAAHEKALRPWEHETFALFLCGMDGCTAGLSGLSGLYEEREDAYICRCLYEAQDHDNSSFLKKCVIDISICLTTPLDAHAFGYCLTNLHLQFRVQSIGTSLEPLLSCLRNTLSGSIKHLPIDARTVQDHLKILKKFERIERPVSEISIDIMANDDLQWLSELIPCTALQSITHLALSYKFERKFDFLENGGCTKGGAELCKFISSSVHLEVVTLKYSSCEAGLFLLMGRPGPVFFDSLSVIEPFASIVEAAMSSLTINKLTTNFAFQVFKNRNVQDIVFDVHCRCYDAATANNSTLNIRRLLMSLWYCIEKGRQSGSILSPKYITLRIFVGVLRGVLGHITVMDHFRYHFQYPMYNFLAIVNEYCKCKPTQLIVEYITCYETIMFEKKSITHSLCCTLNELGRALRREPFLSRCALKKTQSLSDLRTVPSLVELKPISGKNSQSCPDLLELEALTNVHPKLRNIAGILEPSQLKLDEVTPSSPPSPSL